MRFKKIFPFLPFLFLSSAFGQSFILSQKSLNLGTVYTGETDSVEVSIQSNDTNAIVVEDINAYNSVFYVKDTAFTILPHGWETFYVYFHPRHNILYNSELVVLTKGKHGSAFMDLRGQGRLKDTYYQDTENQSEEALKQALRKLLAKNYHQLGYDKARDTMYGVIDNIGGQVECIYTGRKGTFSTRSGATSAGFNTEHTFPQSLFGSDEPFRSDLHHLFPADETANSKRSNLPFGVVTSPSWQSGGSQLGNNVFEPRDVSKGDIARALFYFVVRYQDYSGFVKPQENILRIWAAQDVPDTKEIKRNNDIYMYQRNRNPFIDHPEFLERITSLTTTSVAAASYAYALPRKQIDLTDVVNKDTIYYLFPLEATGNRTLYLKSASFSSPDYTLLNKSDSIPAYESGYVTFRYIGVPATLGGTDTLYLALDANGEKNIIVPILKPQIVSVKALAAQGAFKVYPNPFTSNLSLDLPALPKAGTMLHIYNTLGIDVYTLPVFTQHQALGGLSTLPAGIYYIQLQCGQNIYSQPLIKR